MNKRYYAIRRGRESNQVVDSWAKCSSLVTGFPGAIYKGFPSWQENEAKQFAKESKYKNQSKPKTREKSVKPNKPRSNDRYEVRE